MELLGENFVILAGVIKKPTFKNYGDDYGFYSAYLNIPVGNGSKGLKISAKGDMANLLYALQEGTFIRLHGHIEEKSYDGSCRHCSGPEKKYWTDVQVDNFVIIN